MITIGESKLRTSKPEDLDERLLISLGINADEMARMLRGYPRAQTVAQALIPFLGAEAPSMPELAAQIAAEDIVAIQAAVLKLYGDDAGAEQVMAVGAATGSDGGDA